jgi:hypothetical protein
MGPNEPLTGEDVQALQWAVRFRWEGSPPGLRAIPGLLSVLAEDRRRVLEVAYGIGGAEVRRQDRAKVVGETLGLTPYQAKDRLVRAEWALQKVVRAWRSGLGPQSEGGA